KGRELLSLDERAEPTALTCCELICGKLARQLETGPSCVTERVLESGESLPDAPLELTGVRGASTVSVSAARVDAEDVRVLFQLRPDAGHAGAPRQVASPTAGGRPRLRIETLGRTRVSLGGDGLAGDWLDQRPGLLLKYLVCRRHGVAASDQIAEALWPDASPAEALGSLRHYVHVLRERLEPKRSHRAPSSFVATRPGGYQLDAAQVWVDAEELERLAHEGLRLFVEGQLDPATAILAEAVALYRGEFLPAEQDAEWVLEERERLHHLAARALAALVELRLATGDLGSAADCSRRLADLEPLDMDVQRQFIELCLKQGRRSDAVRRYDLLRTRTLREFGAEPDFALSDLPG
ncbi:MAG TPA: BTAD domain-containing putative transcriptional regulator, partial [Solirubrobacterales bacterium]